MLRALALLLISFSPALAPAAPRVDSRVLKVFRLLRGCPARAYAQLFVDVSDENGLDWRLLPVLAFLETTGGKTARSNNLFGWDNGNAEFESPQESIRFVGSRLGESSLYLGQPLSVGLRRHNQRRSYAKAVRKMMRKLENY